MRCASKLRVRRPQRRVHGERSRRRPERRVALLSEDVAGQPRQLITADSSEIRKSSSADINPQLHVASTIGITIITTLSRWVGDVMNTQIDATPSSLMKTHTIFTEGDEESELNRYAKLRKCMHRYKGWIFLTTPGAKLLLILGQSYSKETFLYF